MNSGDGHQCSASTLPVSPGICHTRSLHREDHPVSTTGLVRRLCPVNKTLLCNASFLLPGHAQHLAQGGKGKSRVSGRHINWAF